ncbi:MAG: hypothetical protein ABEJ69_00530 [Candidatus Nanohaloarchaea archaeon]
MEFHSFPTGNTGRRLSSLDPELRASLYYLGEGEYRSAHVEVGDRDDLERAIEEHLYDRGYPLDPAGEIVSELEKESDEGLVNGETIKRVLSGYEETMEPEL